MNDNLSINLSGGMAPLNDRGFFTEISNNTEKEV